MGGAFVQHAALLSRGCCRWTQQYSAHSGGRIAPLLTDGQYFRLKCRAIPVALTAGDCFRTLFSRASARAKALPRSAAGSPRHGPDIRLLSAPLLDARQPIPRALANGRSTPALVLS